MRLEGGYGSFGRDDDVDEHRFQARLWPQDGPTPCHRKLSTRCKLRTRRTSDLYTWFMTPRYHSQTPQAQSHIKSFRCVLTSRTCSFASLKKALDGTRQKDTETDSAPGIARHLTTCSYTSLTPTNTVGWHAARSDVSPGRACNHEKTSR